MSVPRHVGAQPATYIGPALARRSKVSSIDPSPLYPFGYGLSYTAFRWESAGCQDAEWRPGGGDLPATEVRTDSSVTVWVTVRNVGERGGTEVVPVYLHDPVAQVTRPAVCLIGYERVDLEPGQSRTVVFMLHTDLMSFTGRRGTRIVEPGRVEPRLGLSSDDTRVLVPVELTGPERTIEGSRQMTAQAKIT